MTDQPPGNAQPELLFSRIEELLEKSNCVLLPFSPKHRPLPPRVIEFRRDPRSKKIVVRLSGQPEDGWHMTEDALRPVWDDEKARNQMLGWLVQLTEEN